ncbi:MAG: biosynthetic-type acetolactate synthase large subunit [Clostridia bacterium]|nr:biosynthetic-type acetolactate synthase large subunit [Clostridia bacterium]
MNGAQILIETLVSEGVKTVFGYPGGSVLTIYDELYKNAHRISHVISAHEQGAAHAADGYARVTGKVGVVIATSGPGATNLVTGIANAYLDSVPIVAITGNVATPLLGRDSFQEVDIVGITLPIVKHSYIVKDVNQLESTLKKAFLIAKSGRPGPVLVDIPKDVQMNKCEYANLEIEAPCKSNNNTLDYEQTIDIISQSKKPYIYCGGGVVTSDTGNLVVELSKKLSAPIGLSMMGMSAIPSNYELNLGMVGMHGKYSASKAISESDLIIGIGVRFSDRATGDKNEYTKKCKIIHIDVDPAEINKNITIDMDLCGDTKAILEQLINKTTAKDGKDWLNEVSSFVKEQNKYEKSNDKMTPKNVIEMINSYCDADTVIATDVGQHQMWTMQYFKFQKARTLLTSGGLGTMGYGMGASIGGCIANDRKKTVLFTGDGSFGMNLNEMATLVSQKLPIVIVLLNNGVLGMVRQWQQAFFEERFSQTTLNRKTDFALLAKSFGAKGYRVETLEALKNVLDSDFNSEEPMLIDCKIDMDEKVLPMIPPGASIKEIILE